MGYSGHRMPCIDARNASQRILFLRSWNRRFQSHRLYSFRGLGLLSRRPRDVLWNLYSCSFLVLSWWGDVFLLSKSEPIFKLGILAFLLGHVAYAIAFVQSAFSWTGALMGLAVVSVVAYFVGRWLIPKLDAGMKPAVIAYIAVISTMVVFATALSVATMHFQVLVGAIMFFVSDLAVAKHRFVSPGFSNKIWGYRCIMVLKSFWFTRSKNLRLLMCSNLPLCRSNF